jgi:hypothetical protein
MRRVGISVMIAIATSYLWIAMMAHFRTKSVGMAATRWPDRARGTTLIVPAYFYPSGPRLADWYRMAEAARSVPLEVILNPASGPGRRRDRNYVAVVDRLRRSGARILAYVDSDYGRRAMRAIVDDVRRYREFYAVDGYFIDQMANTAEAVDFYRSIRRLIGGIDPRLKVVGNPGTPYTLPEYLDAADTLVTFEGSARSVTAYDPQEVASWTDGQPPDRFAVIVYGVGTPAAGRDALTRARSSGAGSVYITDQQMPNPYLGLPPYWDDLLAAIRAMNAPAGDAESPAPARVAAGYGTTGRLPVRSPPSPWPRHASRWIAGTSPGARGSE